MSVFSLINISEIEWPVNLDTIPASNYLSIVFIGLHCLVILVLPLSYCLCRGIWMREKSVEKLAAFLDGTDYEEPEKIKVALTVSILFFARRMYFSFTLIHWQEFFWGQISGQFLFTTATIIFYEWSHPLDSKEALRVEVFNEVITMMLSYLLMLYTDFVPLAETRYNLGFVYISLVCFMALVHMLLMVCPACKSTYTLCRYCYIRRQKRKKLAKKTDAKIKKRKTNQK